MAALGVVVASAVAPTAGDTVLKNLLEGAGHSVTFINDEDAVGGTYGAYVLAESCSSATLGGKYDTVAVPCVVLEISVWDDMRLATAAGTTAASSTDYDLLTHEITTGLPDPATVKLTSTSQYSVLNSALPSGAVPFARAGADATRTTGWVVEAGGILTSGTAPARRVALGYIDNWPPNLTADGETLLLQAVEWVLGSVVAVSVWDGASELPATLTVWDGASEVAANIDEITS